MGLYYSPGSYVGKVVNQAMGEAKTGSPQFVLTFLVLGKIDPSEPDGALIMCNQYERSVFRVITPNTMEYVNEDLEKLGIEIETFAQLNPEHASAKSVIGQEFIFRCEHSTYEGVEREKWNLGRSGGGLEIKPLDDKGLRQLDAMFGKQLKKPKGNGAQTTVQEAKAVAPESGDSIPFLWLLPFVPAFIVIGEALRL